MKNTHRVITLFFHLLQLSKKIYIYCDVKFRYKRSGLIIRCAMKFLFFLCMCIHSKENVYQIFLIPNNMDLVVNC